MKNAADREEDSVFDSTSDSVYKLMVLGDGGVGKSALTLQLVLQRFEENWDPTVEDTYRKTVVIDGKTVQLDILDTSGQDQFLAMRESNMRSREGFLLVFDVTKSRTLEVLDEEVRRLERTVDRPPALIVVANKCDLPVRDVDMSFVHDLAASWNALFIETSAKTRQNVEETFYTLVKEIRRLRRLHPKPDQSSTSQSCCCAIM